MEQKPNGNTDSSAQDSSNSEQPTLSFNKSLKARLVGEGYTQAEQVLGTICAEFKSGLKMLTHMCGRDGMLPSMMLSSTMAKLIGEASRAMGATDPKRIITVSDIVLAACNAEGERLHAEHAAGCPDCGQSQSGIVMAARAGLDDLPATDPKDIN